MSKQKKSSAHINYALEELLLCILLVMFIVFTHHESVTSVARRHKINNWFVCWQVVLIN